MERIYLMPHVFVGTWLIPKYCNVPTGETNPDQLITAGVDSYSCRPMGFDDWCIVDIDTDVTTHATIASQGDVYQFPENLDDVIPGATTTVIGNRLRQNGIPANWLVQGLTYRQALRELLIIMQIFQEYKGDTSDSIYVDGDTLSTRGNQMTAERKARINAIRTRRGLGNMANNQDIEDALDEIRAQNQDRNGNAWGTFQMKGTTF